LQSAQLQQQLDSQLHTFVKQFLTALPQQALQLVAAHKTHTHTAATTTASNTTASTGSSPKEVQQLELEQPPAIPRAQSCMKITPDRLMIALESSAVFKTVTDVHNTSTDSHKVRTVLTYKLAYYI
jgi:hypothetical protein